MTTQAIEMESLCYTVSIRADITRDGLSRTLDRLEKISDTGFLDERSMEAHWLLHAENELREVASRIDAIRSKLVAQCPA